MRPEEAFALVHQLAVANLKNPDEIDPVAHPKLHDKASKARVAVIQFEMFYELLYHKDLGSASLRQENQKTEEISAGGAGPSTDREGAQETQE